MIWSLPDQIIFLCLYLVPYSLHGNISSNYLLLYKHLGSVNVAKPGSYVRKISINEIFKPINVFKMAAAQFIHVENI